MAVKAKKVAAKKVGGKQPGTKSLSSLLPGGKPVAKKVAATTKPKADPAAAASRKAEAEAKRASKDSERDAQITEVMRLRSEGQKWDEVAAGLGLSIGKAQLLFQIGEGRAAGTKKATPALVMKDRDEGKMGWVEIACRYGLTKAATQKLYREAGGDPHKSYVGKGGRYFSHEADIAPLRAAKAAAKVAAPKSPKAAPAAKASGKPVFADDVDAEAVRMKISGKTITSVANLKGVESVKEFKVKADSVKVGKSANGKFRVIQFTNAETGGTHTLHLSSITKVSR